MYSGYTFQDAYGIPRTYATMNPAWFGMVPQVMPFPQAQSIPAPGGHGAQQQQQGQQDIRQQQGQPQQSDPRRNSDMDVDLEQADAAMPDAQRARNKPKMVDTASQTTLSMMTGTAPGDEVE